MDANARMVKILSRCENQDRNAAAEGIRRKISADGAAEWPRNRATGAVARWFVGGKVDW